MASHIDRVLAASLAARKDNAICGAKLAVDWLQSEGIEAFVIGSLASGQFMHHSDVDFLVTGHLSPHRRARAEALVSRAMRQSGIAYDIVYADDVRPECLPEFRHAKLAASDLSKLANEIGESGSRDAQPD